MTQNFCADCGSQVNFTAQFCNSCGANMLNSLTGKLQANTMLDGRYLIHAMVGQGGMGAVYKAVDTRIQGKVCAIKEMSVLQLPSAERLSAIQLFEQEARLLADLSHPALPKVSDYFQEGHSGRHYLVMDVVEGDSLENLLARQGTPFSEDQVRQWGMQLCDVLTYLHNQSPPIIFRDLNPRNVMVNPATGDLKLIDFGIARFFKPGNTADTQAFGSPGYAPPEQWGQAQTDARSDTYSLGVTILNLTTMHDPSVDPFNLPSARTLIPTLSPELDTIIQRATQHAPDARYQTANEMQYALHGGSVGRGKEEKRVTWALVRGIGGILMLLFLIGAYLLMNREPDFASRTPAPTHITTSTATSVSVSQIISQDNVSRIKKASQYEGAVYFEWLPDGRSLALVKENGVAVYEIPDIEPTTFFTATLLSAIDFDQTVEHLLLGYEDGRVHLLPVEAVEQVERFRLHDNAVIDIAFGNTENEFASATQDEIVFISPNVLSEIVTYHGDVTDIEFSPDYQWLGIGGQDGTVKLWDTDSKSIVHTLTENDSSVNAISFSPDGKFLVSGDDDGKIYLWNLENFLLETTTDRHQQGITSLAFSPDGKLIVSAGKDGLIQFWSSDSLILFRTIRLHPDEVVQVGFSADGRFLASRNSNNVVQFWGVP